MVVLYKALYPSDNLVCHKKLFLSLFDLNTCIKKRLIGCNIFFSLFSLYGLLNNLPSKKNNILSFPESVQQTDIGFVNCLY